MSTSNFLDANVWLALLWNRHVHSERAAKWYQRSDDELCSFCRFTQLTVLRLLTTEKIMGSDVRSMAGAWEIWARISADSRIAFLPEPDGIEPELRMRSSLLSRSPKVWADAYLLSFAATAGVRLITFDRALRSRGTDVLVL